MPKKKLIAATSEFGERLKRARGLHLARTGEDPTQAELADLVGGLVGRTFDQTTAGSWFKGRIPQTVTIAALAEVYGVRAAWLAFGEGGPEKPEDLPPVKLL